MVVVEGGYRPRLRHAAREAKTLRKTYGATLVKARMPDVLRCLSGAELPDARALHFAVHGTFAAQEVVDSGLRLADREYLSPAKVEGSRLANQPLVFLNACQVASGSMQLGMSASLPDAFLAAQATGVVAPLWSVHDDEALTVADDFYREVLAGVHPAEYVRRLRASVDLGGELDRRTASRLAYQFYGHPVLTVRPLPRAT
jgi:CHAT domain-containing protein